MVEMRGRSGDCSDDNARPGHKITGHKIKLHKLARKAAEVGEINREKSEEVPKQKAIKIIRCLSML